MIKPFAANVSNHDAQAKLAIVVGERLLERLDLVQIQPSRLLDFGAGAGHFSQLSGQRYQQSQVYTLDHAVQTLVAARSKFSPTDADRLICADAEKLPLTDNSVDIIFSNLLFHMYEHIETVFKELQRVLRPDGLLLFSMLGPDTHKELCQSCLTINHEMPNNPFYGMQDIGDLMLAADFKNPVVDRETITLTYQDFDTLQADIKVLNTYGMATSQLLAMLAKIDRKQLINAYRALYADNERFLASHEIIYGCAWGQETDTSRSSDEVSISLASMRAMLNKKDIS